MISAYNSAFFLPILTFSGHISTFSDFECKCEKSVYFESFCKKERVIILPVSIILSLIPSQIHTKSIKLKPPKVDRVNGGGQAKLNQKYHHDRMYARK